MGGDNFFVQLKRPARSLPHYPTATPNPKRRCPMSSRIPDAQLALYHQTAVIAAIIETAPQARPEDMPGLIEKVTAATVRILYYCYLLLY